MSSNALLKALHVLEVFQNPVDALSVKELAIYAGETESSVQRSAYTLEKLGYLERESAGTRYVPGRSCLGPAYGFLRNNKFLEVATPFLIDLAKRVSTRAHLSALDGTDIVYLSRIPSQEERLNLSPLGRRWPVFCTSSGRAILAALPETERDEILAASTLTKITPQTLVDPKAIVGAIEQAHIDGYAFQCGEVLQGAASVASAIVDAKRRVHGAVLLGGPASAFQTPEQRSALGEAAKQAAGAIGACNLS